jgi:chloramphenicol-sensitive protein RarD
MASASPTSETSRGFVMATSAFLIWGLVLPVYMKMLAGVPAFEIIAHRIIWAVPFTAVILAFLGGFRSLGPVFRSPKTLAFAALTAAIISMNWGLYVYAIIAGHAIDAALGYYINPLVNVVMGAVFLGERPTRAQIGAIVLAVLAVALLTWQAGGLPWISLVLAFSFGTYGLLRKILPIGAAEGFFVEVVLLTLPCLAVIGWSFATGTHHFAADPAETWLLIGAGPLTATPLILFAAGARALDYSTVGILQYIAPTMIFVTAVFLFGEPFSSWDLAAFALIWLAVAIYVWSMLHERRARRQAERLAESACL